ncbi:MAG: FKBP-type peptidyl-prolyl cis-trans isomerase [Gammaproteobacteria bacterium]
MSIAIVGLCMAGSVCMAGEQPKLATENERINYSLGYQIGGDLKSQQVEVDGDILLRGIRDAMDEAEPLLDEAEMHNTLVELKRKVVALQAQERAAAQQKNLQAGEAFLAENAKQDGVVVLPSGLQYRVLEPGSGKQPAATDTVTVHYRGTLVDGTEFDSSYSRNKPATFRADRVIPGWREALQLMQEGAKWELFIPAKLGYGERGAGKIQPNSALIFEVQLLEVKGQ